MVEYQKAIHLLHNTPNQLFKFRTKNWIEINEQSRGVYNTSSDIRFKTKMLKYRLCDYSNAYILVRQKITITGAGDDAARQEDERNKGVIFKNCVPFINCKSETNNAETDNAEDRSGIKCEANLILTWSSTCVITYSIGAGRFAIIDKKLYVPVVTLLTQDNAKLIQKIKSGFKRTINWININQVQKHMQKNNI